MGFRFSRRIKILPSITLNVSKSGVSTSIGGRGARVTLGRGKIRETVGIPGTGISYTHVESTTHKAPELSPPIGGVNSPSATRGLGWLLVLLAILAYLIWQFVFR
jgi:hypothetical protein